MGEWDEDEREDGDEAGSGAAREPDEPERGALITYIVDEVGRGFAAHDRAAGGTIQRALPLGEMLALFNLADQFGLLDEVRATLDRRRGDNAYLAFSEAMKNALLDRGFGPGPRPGGPPRPAGGGQRPPGRGPDRRPGGRRGG